MIDINRIHDVIEGRVAGRRCGQTTAMLTTCLGYADFDVPEFYILCGTTANAERCLRDMIMIALGMGFEDIQELPANILRVNKTLFCFRAKTEPIGRPEAPVVHDTFYATFLEICRDRQPNVMFHEADRIQWATLKRQEEEGFSDIYRQRVHGGFILQDEFKPTTPKKSAYDTLKKMVKENRIRFPKF